MIIVSIPSLYLSIWLHIYSIDHSYIMRAHHALFWLLHSHSWLSILTEYIYLYSLPLTDIDFRYRGDLEDIMLPMCMFRVLLQVVTVGCACVLYAGGTLDRREKNCVCLCRAVVHWECLVDVFPYVWLCFSVVRHGVFWGRLRSSRYAVRLYIGDMYHQMISVCLYGPYVTLSYLCMCWV